MYSSLKADKVFSLATITILTTGLEIIWPNRQQKKTLTLFMVRAELECAVSIRVNKKIIIFMEFSMVGGEGTPHPSK